MSGHCGFWANQAQCDKNPNFMKEKCMLTCNYCTSNGDSADKSGEARDEL